MLNGLDNDVAFGKHRSPRTVDALINNGRDANRRVKIDSLKHKAMIDWSGLNGELRLLARHKPPAFHRDSFGHRVLHRGRPLERRTRGVF
jgi:hypothetical protein